MVDNNCPICFSPFNRPCCFPCGHTYNFDCIDSLVTVSPSLTQNVRDRFVACPECRRHWKVSDAVHNVALSRALENPAHVPARPTLRRINFSAQTYADARDGDDELDAIQLVKLLRFSTGLARTVIQSEKTTGMRIFILDNSGSTHAPDGSLTVIRSENPFEISFRPVTRWEEIKQAAMKQAAYAFYINVPTEFHILNPKHNPPREGVDYCRIHKTLGTLGTFDEQMGKIQQMLDGITPGGTTPLARSLGDVYQSIEKEKKHFSENGKRVFVCILTDGKPNRKESMVRQMRRLVSQLPVCIVIRLCTDDDDVVEFYQDLDSEEEFSLDVIDDWKAEAKEIKRVGNDWFVYSQALHLVREAGIAIRLFDLMDEKRFKSLQIPQFVKYLIKPSDADPALEDWQNYKQYCNAVEGYVNPEKHMWDPLQKKSKKIITTARVKVVLKRGNRDPYIYEDLSFTAQFLFMCFLSVLVIMAIGFFSD